MKRTPERKVAKANGELRYFTGQACSKGHLAFRFTKCGKCVECHRIFQAEWRKTNPEKASMYVGRWRGENREHCRQYTKRWQQENPEKVVALNAAYYAANPEHHRERARNWHRNNPEEAKLQAHRRRARILSADGEHSAADLREILKLQNWRCAYCRRDLEKCGLRGRHLDHIIPLAKGGTNDRKNLQFCCQPCNQRKSHKHPLTFARQIGLLL